MLQIIDRVDEIKTFKRLHCGVEDRCSTVEKVLCRGGSLGHRGSSFPSDSLPKAKNQQQIAHEGPSFVPFCNPSSGPYLDMAAYRNMDLISSYLPTHEGLLPKWLLLVSFVPPLPVFHCLTPRHHRSLSYQSPTQCKPM
jgi:hypothetical protein